MHYFKWSVATLRGLGVDPRRGLTASEVEERLARFGPNVLGPGATRSVWLEMLRPLRDPMVLLLLGAGGVYLLLGETFNAAVMLVAIIPIAAVDLVLEVRAERALDELRKLSAPRADVKRDGKWTNVDATVLVPGDIVRVEEGDVVPADGVVLTASDLQVDQSPITGESQPIPKEGAGWPPARLEAERQAMLAGTTVLSGRGEMAVVETGEETIQGEIGALVLTTKLEPTPTERAIRQLVTYLGAGAAVLIVGVVFVLLVQGASLGDALISAISLGIAAIPEEFAIIFVLFLALGARYLANRNALVRRLAAIETLGTVDVIATDKTGTLTLGQLAVSGLWIGGQVLNAEAAARSPAAIKLVEAAVLASEPSPFDPLERTINSYARQIGVDPGTLYRQRAMVKEYRFESERRYMSHIWRSSDGRLLLCAKGAVESILALSVADPSERQQVLAANTRLATQGMRVIAVAQRYLQAISGNREVDERGLSILGLIGLSDPPRRGVKEAVAESQRAGIRVLMVTGDHPLTAHAIAEAIGLIHADDRVVTGAEIEEMSPAQLRERVADTNIFARILPAQKYRLVQSLKNMSHVVAVTGDGVNDAPALRAADIGIAMGRRGTDVARSAAAMVLLDDNFGTIVDAVGEGRRIFGNLQKAFSYLIAYHVPIVLLALFVPLAGLPLLLLPIHLVWLELVIHPTASFVFLAEPADPDVMRRPPRKRDEPFLTPLRLGQLVAAGLGLLFISLGIYLFNLAQGQPVGVARALALGALILGNAALAEIERSGFVPKRFRGLRGNLVSAAILSLAIISFLAIVYVPGLAVAFEVEPPAPVLWLEPLALVLAWGALTVALRSLAGSRVA
ncbi:MAG: cation-translocating P-type ATPase [Chloroflexota bacterium]